MSRFVAKPGALPLTLAIQCLALVLFAFFTSDPVTRQNDAAGGAGSPDAGAIADAQLELPRDLAPQRLPVPRLPDVEKPDEPEAPKPDDEGAKAPVVRGPKLSNLRTQTIALASLAPVNFDAPLPGAPDSLVGQSLSGRTGASWLAGTRSAQNGSGDYAGPSDTGDGNGGWAGSGIGGRGSGGSGGYCPTPGGIGGRGRGGSGGAPGRGVGTTGGRGRPVGTTAGGGGSGASSGSGSGERGKPAGTRGGGKGRSK